MALHSADGNVKYGDYVIYADQSGDPNTEPKLLRSSQGDVNRWGLTILSK